MIQFDYYLVLNKAYIKMMISFSVGLAYQCSYYPVHATTLTVRTLAKIAGYNRWPTNGKGDVYFLSLALLTILCSCVA